MRAPFRPGDTILAAPREEPPVRAHTEFDSEGRLLLAFAFPEGKAPAWAERDRLDELLISEPVCGALRNLVRVSTARGGRSLPTVRFLVSVSEIVAGPSSASPPLVTMQADGCASWLDASPHSQWKREYDRSIGRIEGCGRMGLFLGYRDHETTGPVPSHTVQRSVTFYVELEEGAAPDRAHRPLFALRDLIEFLTRVPVHAVYIEHHANGETREIYASWRNRGTLRLSVDPFLPCPAGEGEFARLFARWEKLYAEAGLSLDFSLHARSAAVVFPEQTFGMMAAGIERLHKIRSRERTGRFAGSTTNRKSGFLERLKEVWRALAPYGEPIFPFDRLEEVKNVRNRIVHADTKERFEMKDAEILDLSRRLTTIFELQVLEHLLFDRAAAFDEAARGCVQLGRWRGDVLARPPATD